MLYLLSFQDELKFSDLAAQFEEEGYGVEKSNSYVWKIFHKSESDEIEERVVDYRYPFYDVFVMKWVKNKYVIKDKAGQNAWRNEFYSDEQIKNIEYRQFGDYQLPCPGSPEDYLARTYEYTRFINGMDRIGWIGTFKRRILKAGTVPATKFLVASTVPASNFYLKNFHF